MASVDILSIKQRFGIIGNSPLLNVAIEKAALAAPTDMTVLITGESGSGKESFSKIIHQLSSRKHNQFIAINCGAIPEGTIDSELFGHEKGAFTGAVDSRKGYFETVNGGTIFLDEIGEMPLGTQARLLRVLENGDFIRVGSSKVQKTDVRVVAATNVNLLQAVEKGTFREDLYYRLNTIPIFVPPLRERGADILLLFRKFASDFAERYRVKPVALSEDASQMVLNYRFPGNIRQLKNLVEQISVLEMEREINAEKLRNYLPQDQSSNLPALLKTTDSQNFTERELLYKVLFDLKRDVTELKKLFYDSVSEGRLNGDVLKHHPELFREIEDEPVYPIANGTPKPIYLSPEQDNGNDIEVARIEDISHETEDDSLDLNKKEKEMIIRALRKHRNKRKYAAEDLKISERTLYRKIKQYNIE
ncbi:MAG: sigma-54 dependent transcriptional regulator [Cytophagales bacterium]|jgi:transcriptional regulator with PAS, ATPase and Fis domain|nr:sigma-54 dependent transcriptional regulator [Cytophagales bacterium]